MVMLLYCLQNTFESIICIIYMIAKIDRVVLAGFFIKIIFKRAKSILAEYISFKLIELYFININLITLQLTK